MESRNRFGRGRAAARWTERELAGVVGAVLGGAPEVLWSVDDVRERLAFGREGGGPAATSVRAALGALERDGRVERIDVWGRRGWGNTAHAFRAARVGARARLPLAA
jgi:hypothetical protein